VITRKGLFTLFFLTGPYNSFNRGGVGIKGLRLVSMMPPEARYNTNPPAYNLNNDLPQVSPNGNLVTTFTTFL